MSYRRRPLHTCAVSIIRVAQTACDVGKDLIEPLSSNSTVKRMVKIISFVTPFYQALLYFWLVVLSFIDDQIILFYEDIVERFFPPSRRVFDKIDDLIQVIETLPGKFDYAVKEFPPIVHKFPFLYWALLHVLSLLKLLITTLTYWSSEGTNEKDIMVDINCDNNRDKDSKAEHVSTSVDEAKNQTEANDGRNGDFVPVVETNVELDRSKSICEEVVENEKTDERSEIVCEKENREESEKTTEKKDEIPKDDPIVELFESGWLMRRGRRGKGGSVSGPLS